MPRRLGKIAGVHAAERLRRAVHAEARMFGGVQPPDDAQIAMVLHALADHTSLVDALMYVPDEGVPWSQATSLGRWLHAYGDLMGERQ